MTKSKKLRPLVPNSSVETLCMAMFRAGVTETSYPQHPGMTGSELAEMTELEKSPTIKTAAGMVNSGRLVITTPEKRTNRRYVLSAAQVFQCAEVLRAQPEQPVQPEQPEQSKSKLIQREILKSLHAGGQFTSGQIRAMIRDHGFRANSVYSQLWYMYLRRMIHRSGVPGEYVYSLPTQPAETAELLTPPTFESQMLEALSGGHQLTSGEIASLLAERGFSPTSVPSQLYKMWKQGKLQRSGVPGCYVYRLPTQPAEDTEPAEHTEPAETAELSNSDHTDSSIVQATIDAFHQAGEPLSDEQIEALHHMHPDRHRVLCDRVAAKALAKVRQEREAREARETALFEEYLQAAVEAEQMELLDT